MWHAGLDPSISIVYRGKDRPAMLRSCVLSAHRCAFPLASKKGMFQVQLAHDVSRISKHY
ncbi:mCG1047116 [Mus musculus]|nr:mCG1047116 [Mus musculus]